MTWEARHTQMWQLHTQGLSQSAIARAMAMPRTTVRDGPPGARAGKFTVSW
jgi:hypothetical protein